MKERRTTQLTVTIDREVMKKYLDFKFHKAKDTPINVLPRSTVFSYILDWALSQKNLKDGLMKLIAEKYTDTYQAWYKDSVRDML